MTTAPRLRPMSLTELLDRSIRLYRRHFLQFVSIIAVVQIPIALLSLILGLVAVGGTAWYQDQDPEEAYLDALQADSPFDLLGAGYWIGTIGNVLLSIVGYVLLQGFATGALSRAVASHYLGETLHFVDAYLGIGSLWKRLVGGLLLASITALGLAIWMLIPCVGWLTGIGILLFWSTVISPLIAPIVVLERQKPGAAIRRAWDLARRRFWPVVGFVAVLWLLNQLIIAGPSALVSFVLQFLTADMMMSDNITGAATIQAVVETLVALVGGLIYLPLQLTSMILLYFDLRVRTEGFDLALLAQSPAEGVRTAEVVAQAPLPEGTKLVTRREVGYFVLLSVGGLVLVVVLGGILMALGAGSVLLAGMAP